MMKLLMNILSTLPHKSEAATLNPESLEPHIDNLLPETRGWLEHRVMALSAATVRNLCYIIKFGERNE